MKLVRMHSNFNSIIFSIVLCYKNCTINRKDSFSISTYDAWIQQQFLYEDKSAQNATHSMHIYDTIT